MSSATATVLRKAYFIKVAANENNNKFYNLEELGDGTFKTAYGRVGGHETVDIHNMSEWDSVCKTRLKHGYKDKTHLFAEEIKKDEGKSTITEITNKIVSQLVNELRSYANESVETNYIVNYKNVTQAMVDEAQTLVDEITKMIKVGQDTEPMNKILVDLFAVIPRKMSHVKDYLFEGDTIKNKTQMETANQIIHNEQQTLDVMAGQVSTHSKIEPKQANAAAANILDAMGLLIEEAPSADIPIIKKLMGPNANQFKKAYIVINKKTQKKFDKHLSSADIKKTELFWHGSRNENWWSILDKGWMLRPANAAINGKMFGYGIYWADKFQKSLGYTSYSGARWTRGNSAKAFLSLAVVHVGKQLDVTNHQSWCYDLTWNNLRKRGDYDSLFAHGGADLVNNEFIVYTEDQCTVKYLIEVQ